MVGGMQWQVNESRGVDDISKGLLAEKSQFRSLRDLSMVGCGPAAMQPFGTHSQPQRNVSVTMVELPATGRFSIGTKIYNWVDRSRRELASKNPADSRQLIVQVWYPTEDRSRPASPYVPMLSSYRHIWEDSDVDVASRTLTHSRLDAKPMSSVQFPVVLLSHG
jgi:hypothetical protein